MIRDLKIDYDKMTVEIGNITLDMEMMSAISNVYERLCTADYVLDNHSDLFSSMEEAYVFACVVRDRVADVCECESYILDDELSVYRANKESDE